MKETWAEIYAADENTDGYLEIKNTRLIELHENELEEFKDVDCVVEFLLYSDYFGTAPYYQHIGIYEDVVLYKNGSAEILQKDPFQHYASTHYSTDYVELMQYVNDLKDEYNQVLWLK